MTRRFSADDLSEFPDPDLGPWQIRISGPRLPKGPLASIAVVGLGFFSSSWWRADGGGLGDGIVKLLALAVLVSAIVLVTRYASTSPTGCDDAAEPRDRPPDS